MRQSSRTSKDAADKLVRGIKRKTRKQYSAEESERSNAIGPREPANQDRLGWSARRGKHRRLVPPRGHRREPVLFLVEGVSGGWKEPFGGR